MVVGVIGLLLLVAAAWLVLLGFGLALCTVLPAPARRALLPAAPALGAALAVVVLHAASLVTGTRLGLLLLVAVVPGLVLAGRRRDDRGLPRDRSVLVALLAAPLVGGLAAGLVLVPSAVYDGALVLPSSNHDAFYYTGLGTWLEEHRGLDRPELGPSPEASDAVPYEASALRHVEQGLRLGESLLQSALTTALGVEAETTWYAFTATWLLLLPASAAGAAALLGLSSLVGVAAGAVAVLSPVLVRQAYNQNSASLLGIALAPLALVLAARALRRGSGVPTWAAALVLAGWLGTYTEYAVLAIPALAVAVLARRPAEVPATLGRAVIVAALGVALAPLVAWNAVRSLIFLSGAPPAAWVSPFLDVGLVRWASRVTGASTPFGVEPGTLLPLLLLLLVLAGLLGTALLPERGVLLGSVVAAAAGLYFYGAVDPRPYTQQRLVEIAVPLLLVFAGLGAARLVARAPQAPALVLVAGAGLLLLGASARSDLRLVQEALAQPRPVEPAFEQAAEWVRELGGTEGGDVTVLAGGFFDQLWLAEALRAERAVSYAVLDPSYFTQEAFWAGEADRYLLVDTATWVDGTAPLRENERFRLFDTQGQDVVAAATLGISSGGWYGPEPGPAAWMADDGRLVVWRSRPAAEPVVLQLVANPELAPVPLKVLGGDEPVVGEVAAQGSSVAVPLQAGPVGSVLLLDNLEPAAVAPSTGDARPLSVRLVGVVDG